MLAISYDQAVFIARQHLDAGRVSQAEDLCRRVLKDYPQRAEALHLLGLAASTVGRPEQAIELLRRAINAAPTSAAAHLDLGNALRDARQPQDALAAYCEALRLNPQLAAAHAGAGDVLRHTGDIPQAIAEYRAALQLQPDLAEVHNNLGMAFAAEGATDAAIESYRRAIELNPGMAKAHYNLANAYRSQDKLEEAVAAYRRAIQLRPDFAEAHNNLGDALEASGHVAAAVGAYDEAIRLCPDRSEPHWNRSLALLLQGDYERGWAEYEWRHRRGTSCVRPGPRWDGADLAGRTILLYAEQGLGDTIQFVRYVPMVAARGGRVALECQPQLHRLLDGCLGASEVIPAGQPLPPCDVHCPLMSLPMVFGTRLESVPRDIPYLRADSERVTKWNGILGPHAGVRRVGVAWAGSPDHQYDRNRSMKFSHVAPLAVVDRIELHSLQKGPAATQLPAGNGWIDHTARLTDFAETAALIANLDLVISVDTAVAHLAAALGRPVWLLLAFAPDWRWQRERADSCWYPTVTIFRQLSAGDWTSVVDAVCRNLY